MVRFSNKDIFCQFMYSTLAGDVCVAAARARELPKFGLEVGLSNYAAAYCTGLLAARRVLVKFGLADTYTGVEEATGAADDLAASSGLRPGADGMHASRRGLQRGGEGRQPQALLRSAGHRPEAHLHRL